MMPAAGSGAKYMAEFIGTFFLVLTVGCNVHSGSGAAGASLSIGAMLTVMVYALSSVSGAHLNPAVTAAIWLSGRSKICLTDMWCYMFFQIMGGITAAFTYSLLAGDAFVLKPGGGVTETGVVVVEIIYSWVLCYVVLSVATTKDVQGKHHYGLVIGMTVTSAAVSIGRLSGCSLNPAVTTGTLLAAFAHLGRPAMRYLPHYFFAPFLGALLAAFSFRMVRRSTEYGEKSDHQELIPDDAETGDLRRALLEEPHLMQQPIVPQASQQQARMEAGMPAAGRAPPMRNEAQLHPAAAAAASASHRAAASRERVAAHGEHSSVPVVPAPIAAVPTVPRVMPAMVSPHTPSGLPVVLDAANTACVEMQATEKAVLSRTLQAMEVHVATSWERNASSVGVDIDSSVIKCDREGKCLGAVYFANQNDLTNGINHDGGGSGFEDNEVVTLRPSKVGPEVHFLFFSAMVFTSPQHSLRDLNSITVQLGIGGGPLARFNKSGHSKGSAFVAAMLYRTREGWCFEALDRTYQLEEAQSFRSLEPMLQRICTQKREVSGA